MQVLSVGREIETVMRAVPGTTSVYAERLTGARYVDAKIDRNRAARFGRLVRMQRAGIVA